MAETILTDKPWRYDGFGCIRCGRHIVLQLPPSLADEVSPEELVAIGKLAAKAPAMKATLELALIALRQLIQPDNALGKDPAISAVENALEMTDVKEKT